MPSLAEIELSSIFISPKYLSASPFFRDTTKENQEKGSFRHLTSSIASFIFCSRRALNTRIIGFGDNTLENCSEDFLYNISESKASSHSEDEHDDYRPKTNHFHRRIDPFSLPWKPKQQYLNWLASRHSLPSEVHSHISFERTRNTT